MQWRDQFRVDGYSQFPNITPLPLVKAALEAIASDLTNNYESERQVEYDNVSYCPNLRRTHAIMDLLERSPIASVIDEALGLDKVAWGDGQIAIRRAHNCDSEIPPEPHIDGFASGLNNLEEGKIYNHTATVGVFLTPVTRAFAGNFTVWPGSHHIFENYFRERGPCALKEPMPTPEVGTAVQLLCEAGDAVLCQYELAHSAAVNTSDTDRIAVFFRLWFCDLEKRRWEALTNIWNGWRI
jgi:ectoine hydroxylase-related dioxygenase (phytanoyl-CoA dioxygenase family)